MTDLDLSRARIAVIGSGTMRFMSSRRNNFLDDLEKTPTLLMKPQRLLQDNYQSIYQVL